MTLTPLIDPSGKRWPFEAVSPSGNPSRSIPSLDGLRALSIGLVILSHWRLSKGFPIADEHLFPVIPFTGTAGVCLFFVISGFLITTLLLKEQERTGFVSLRSFYARRSLRIFPAFYVYLLCVLLLSLLGWVDRVHPLGLFSSALYWRNLYSGPPDWSIEHTWSLSIEEQFYLFWPLVIAKVPRRWAVLVGLGLALGWPLLRLVRHGPAGFGSGHASLEAAAMDTILWGSLLAMWCRGTWGRGLLEWAHRTSAGWLVPLFGLWVLYRLNIKDAEIWPQQFAAALPFLRNALLAWLLWWCVNSPGHLFGRFLGWSPLAFVGVISYSLYLWQQLFLGYNTWWPGAFPQNLIFAVAAALVSYYLIERPSHRLRERWQAVGSSSRGRKREGAEATSDCGARANLQAVEDENRTPARSL